MVDIQLPPNAWCANSKMVGAVAASPIRLDDMGEDTLLVILSFLGTVDHLVCGSVSRSFRAVVSRLCFKEILLGEQTGGGGRATDKLLLWLTLNKLKTGAKLLDVAGCPSLSKAAITRAAFAAPTLQHLHGTSTGLCSWTPEQLLRLVHELQELQVLHVDCRTKGASIALFQLLAHPAVRLRKLVLHRARGGAALGLIALASALKRKAQWLHDVDASSGGLDRSEAYEFVARLLEGDDCQVRRLALCGQGAPPPDALEDLASALERNQLLESLELGCNFIGEGGAFTLADPVGIHPTLRVLTLEHNPLQDRGAAALCAALGPHSSLVRLSMPFTGASDGACEALAGALLRGCSLEHVDLGGNSISVIGAEHLAKALASPGTALRFLNLSANYRLRGEGALAVCGALPASKLRELHLAGCGIGSAPCGRIGVALSRSRTIEVLDLSSNELGDPGAWDLAWAIADQRTSLRRLILRANDIEDDGATELFTALHDNETLTCLDLSGNRIGEARAHLGESERVRLGFQAYLK